MGTDDILEISKALGDATRLSIYRYIKDGTVPASIADIAASFRLHPNAIRQHVAKLEEAGLLSSETVKKGTGRPGKVYMVNPIAGDVSLFRRDYKFLATLLLGAMAEGGFPVERLREHGRECGRSIVRVSKRAHEPRPLADEDLLRILTELGFEPELSSHTAGKVTLRLRSCIFGELAASYPDYVCPLVDGIAKGAVEHFPGVEILEHDRGIPRGEGHCSLTIGIPQR